MNHKLLQAAERSHVGAELAKFFAHKYAEKVPEDMGHLLVSQDNVTFLILIEKWDAKKKDAILKTVREIFGPELWTQKMENGRIKWDSMRDAVRVRVDMSPALFDAPFGSNPVPVPIHAFFGSSPLAAA